ETTKSTVEVVAEADGFLIGLQFSGGDKVNAGEILCYLADSPHEVVPEIQPTESNLDLEFVIPDKLRISKPALELVRKLGLNLNEFPVGPLITKKMVRTRYQGVSKDYISVEVVSDPTAIVIYGSGGHGKSVLDLLRIMGTYRVVGFLDDALPAGEEIMGVPVMGGVEILDVLHQQGLHLAINAVGGIGNVKVRRKVFQYLLEANFVLPPIVHPTAFVEPSAELSPGVQVFPHAYVGTDVRVGFGCIINTSAIVSHDCHIDEYSNISPGAILAGGVKVGCDVLIGMGVTINLGVDIGDGAQIGNSATIKDDLPANGIVRAGTIWPCL
ncbi:MAG: NeuD/PglB/VioB family sugar acetyltransferase, partial [Chloroflexi bacterium]|nr:NeuD/PglB/VioB family sugar acetyltransferase [Chloroflexota bacterium]